MDTFPNYENGNVKQQIAVDELDHIEADPRLKTQSCTQNFG